MSDYAIFHKKTRVITGLTTENNHPRIAPDEAVTKIPLKRFLDLAVGPWVLLYDNQTVRKATHEEFLLSLDEDERDELDEE